MNEFIIKAKNVAKVFKEENYFGKLSNWFKEQSPIRKLLILGLGFVLIVLLFSKCMSVSGLDGRTSTKDRPIAVIETNMGVMKLVLYTDKAPKTTQNFIKLSEDGFYDGLIFHRVIPDFMIQGGDPNGNGSGGPGHNIEDEFVPGLSHDRIGVLSMANRGEPDSGGSQFFITLRDNKDLDGNYSIFGQLIEGENVLKKIGKVKTFQDENNKDKPIKPVIMDKVTIIR